MTVHIVCQRPEAPRILPKLARYLADDLGWTISPRPDDGATVNYLFNYGDGWLRYRWYDKTPLAAFYTHYEPGTGKAQLWDESATFVALRICNNEEAARLVRPTGETVRVTAPIEREHFTPGRRAALERRGPRKRPVIGVNGWCDGKTARKGEHLLAELLGLGWNRLATWRASGRGWPVETKTYTWNEMPDFYRGLDYLLCTSLYDAGPAGPLEALCCGIPVIVPSGVGLCDELPEGPGVYHYARGDVAEMSRALHRAMEDPRPRAPEALRRLTEGYTRERWSADHREAFRRMGWTG